MEEYIKLEEKIIETLEEVPKLGPEGVVDELMKFCDFSKEANLWIIGRDLYHVGYAFPRYYISLADAAFVIKERLSDEFKKIWCDALDVSMVSISYDEDDSPTVSTSSHESIYFFGILARKKVVSIEEHVKFIYEKFKGMSEFQKEPLYNALIPLLLTCSKIVSEACPELFAEQREFFMKSNKFIVDEIDNLIAGYKEDLIITPCTIECIKTDDLPYISNDASMHIAFSQDDDDWLRLYLANHIDCDVNYEVQPSIVTPSELLLDHPPLVSVAAFYGAVRCFKYLMMNNASLGKIDHDGISVSQFATAGGSLEIFRLCEQYKVHDSQCAFVAVSYWKTDIINWIIANDDFDLSSSDDLHEQPLICFAASTNNISFVRFLLENGVSFWDHDIEESDDASPMEIACQWDCLSIVMLMCSTLQTIPIKLFKKCFVVSIEFNSFDILEFYASNYRSLITPDLLKEARKITETNMLPKMKEALNKLFPE